jgi:hypothetical protein
MIMRPEFTNNMTCLIMRAATAPDICRVVVHGHVGVGSSLVGLLKHLGLRALARPQDVCGNAWPACGVIKAFGSAGRHSPRHLSSCCAYVRVCVCMRMFVHVCIVYCHLFRRRHVCAYVHASVDASVSVFVSFCFSTICFASVDASVLH